MKMKLSFALFLAALTVVRGQGTGHLPICTSVLQLRHFPSGFDWSAKRHSVETLKLTQIFSVSRTLRASTGIGFSKDAHNRFGSSAQPGLAREQLMF
jgi:hypothetical protein